MRPVISVFKTALAAYWLVVAVCGVSEASSPGSTSLNDTTIPSATYIVDGKGNMWTVSGGVIYEDGALAGYSNEVTKLLYHNDTVYQENAVGGWWSWTGSTWGSSGDPIKPTSPDGASIPATTQFIDGSGNVWTVAGGVIHENGALAGYSKAVIKLLYENYTVYQENVAGGWWAWNGNTWISSGDPSTGGAAAGSSSPNSANVSWTAPTHNTDGTPLRNLAGFRIYYGSNPGTLTQHIQLANPSATSYVVSNLGAGICYFAVAAYTAAGTESAHSSQGYKAIP